MAHDQASGCYSDALLLIANIAPVIAADVRVFSGAAPQHVFQDLAIEFEQASSCGTFRPFSNVRHSVVVRGKPDIETEPKWSG
jgi:hypothetical protein